MSNQYLESRGENFVSMDSRLETITCRTLYLKAAGDGADALSRALTMTRQE